MNTARRSPMSGFKQTMAAFCDRLERKILAHPSFEGKVVFGPVLSRRLGSSLGINNIRRKICSYDCVYCQAGQTTSCSTDRDCCLSPYELYFFVKERIEQLEKEKIHIDYISFVPNGEPTLDNNLSKEIELLKGFGYKIAVFTNSSLLWNDDVKVDTVDEAIWEVLNRPHGRLRFDTILKGVADFAKTYEGVLTTETMLIKNVNDSLDEIGQVGNFLNMLKRNASYFTIPIRPPTEKYAVPPDSDVLEEIAKLVKRTIPKSEMLCCPEIEDFMAMGNIEEELMGILAVQPMRADSVEKLVRSNGGSGHRIEEMMRNGSIHRVMYEGKGFYVGAH
jgi:wyosine [tRNA(Phe)-imidazoG37] synthetase (radical SAM superfamily)